VKLVVVLAGSYGGETTPPSVTTRKSPTMDAGVQTSGGLANNAAPGGGMGPGAGGVPRGQRGGYGRGGGGYNGLGYQRGMDNRRYLPQYNAYGGGGGRYQQNDMRGGQPPVRGLTQR